MDEENKWINIDPHSNRLIIRFRVKGFEKQFFISTRLADTRKNREIVRIRRDLIAADIALGRFDASLKSYQFIPDRDSAKTVQKKLKYEYNLLQLLEKFTDFKTKILERTTILSRYVRLIRYTKRLPTLSLEKAPEIRDWLLNNTTHQMTWEILIYYSSCCEWAVDSGLISNNPFARLKIKKPKRRSDWQDYQAFTLDQRDLIIKAFETHQLHSHYAPLIKFLFWSGCRPGEAFALTWQDVDFNCIRITITKSCNLHRIKKGTKNGKRRVFPTQDGSKLQQMLLGMRSQLAKYNPNDLIFKTKTGLPVTGYALQDVWNEAVSRRNGKTRRYPGVVKELAAQGLVPYLKPYCTRHTFATWAISSGISPDKVAKWIGDEVATVLKHYCHPLVVDSECPDF